MTSRQLADAALQWKLVRTFTGALPNRHEQPRSCQSYKPAGSEYSSLGFWPNTDIHNTSSSQSRSRACPTPATYSSRPPLSQTLAGAPVAHSWATAPCVITRLGSGELRRFVAFGTNAGDASLGFERTAQATAHGSSMVSRAAGLTTTVGILPSLPTRTGGLPSLQTGSRQLWISPCATSFFYGVLSFDEL